MKIYENMAAAWAAARAAQTALGDEEAAEYAAHKEAEAARSASGPAVFFDGPPVELDDLRQWVVISYRVGSNPLPVLRRGFGVSCSYVPEWRDAETPAEMRAQVLAGPWGLEIYDRDGLPIYTPPRA